MTAAEVRLAALDKLNLADKVKGTMLGISADSVKKRVIGYVKNTLH
ncbi:hypothetical protein [Runella sp. SP2]|nr:hypothetical protein [Runella sp. SP2]